MEKKVKVFTDSTADLSPQQLEALNISVLPLYVTMGDKSYRDGVDITTAQLYKMVDELRTLPKTAAAPVEDFVTAFKPWVDQGYDVIFVGISSKLSATIQNALIAADEFEPGRVHVVDSQNLSTGIGLLAVKAAELAMQGMGAQEIVERVNALVPKVRTSFVISTLKYLHMGGRCTSLQLIAGTVLKIKPQIIVKDGGMIVGEKYRGKDKKVLDSFYADHVGDGKNVDLERIFVTHSDYQEGAEYLAEKLKNELNPKEVCITSAGAVISSHCGPGTVGILYLEK
ncbi:DegV family protein [Caldicoprobacter faecalis]|uniref:EDD domain protein, DegV family n=1 Tax=Caldicoprobacter faecalis TaxID=937334 RepID=A0A1I5YCS1_9FIRM|nr:DegV family protein [Caldicoprobacter faecalis]SFQ42031.1 EDD domain protein, DegV family [Caldicoprobacter faecalis]